MAVVLKKCKRNGVKLVQETCSVRFLKKRLPIVAWLPKYNLEKFQGDLIAGLTVGLTVIPQGLAYAAVAELPLQYGLYSAFMGCFIYCLFGTSKDVTLGPTAIISLMTAEYAKGEPTLAIALCLCAGLVQFAMGVLQLGFLVNFMAFPVISGYMSAAALIIGCGQLKLIFGLKNVRRSFIWNIYDTFRKLPETNHWDLTLGIISFVILLIMKWLKDRNWDKDRDPFTPLTTRQRVGRKAIWLIGTGRNALIVIVTTILAGILFSNNIKPFTMTKDVPPGFPKVGPPSFSYQHNNQTVEGEEFLSVTSRNKYRIDATQELLALGIANIVSSFFGSYPMSCSCSRTAINSTSGVRTPLGGIFAAYRVRQLTDPAAYRVRQLTGSGSLPGPAAYRSGSLPGPAAYRVRQLTGSGSLPGPAAYRVRQLTGSGSLPGPAAYRVRQLTRPGSIPGPAAYRVRQLTGSGSLPGPAAYRVRQLTGPGSLPGPAAYRARQLTGPGSLPDPAPNRIRQLTGSGTLPGPAAYRVRQLTDPAAYRVRQLTGSGSLPGPAAYRVRQLTGSGSLPGPAAYRVRHLTVEFGILVGVGLGLVIELYGLAKPGTKVDTIDCCPKIVVVKFDKGLSFPASDFIVTTIHDAGLDEPPYKPVILDFAHVSHLDFSVIRSLALSVEEYATNNTPLYFACVNRDLEAKLKKASIKNLQCFPTVQLATEAILDEGVHGCIGMGFNEGQNRGTRRITLGTGATREDGDVHQPILMTEVSLDHLDISSDTGEVLQNHTSHSDRDNHETTV
uniref:STAS domain-containing protein n=1 Tax=Branchiostoma floridae TaxID=7739 RepID=C3Z714_BRAFL|eukprot:XP_002595598.1 hypothetical protein BRAFLDRAFT_64708 [Branchiostoma floridae]